MTQWAMTGSASSAAGCGVWLSESPWLRRRNSSAEITAPVATEAALAGYATAYWWGAAFFATGAVMSALVFRRRGHGLSLNHTPQPAAELAEPVIAH